MASPNTSTLNPLPLLRKSGKGFTLIEILIVLGILALVVSIGFFVSLDNYRGSSFRSDRDLLVTMLQHARAEAVSNICRGASCTDGQSHGVHIEAKKFVLFQGTTYNASDPLNAVTDANPAITHSGADEIIFAQLSGTASPSGSITLTDQTGRSSIVTVGSEGRIVWTN